MNIVVLALVFSLIAGLGTVLGSAIALFFKSDSQKAISGIISFVMGVFIVILIKDLVPSSWELFIDMKIDNFWAVVFVLVFITFGYIFVELIERLIPGNDAVKDAKLYRTALVSVMAASIHKFPEGIAIFFAFQSNVYAGIALSLGIAIHHIPEGMAIGYPIYKVTKKKSVALKYAFFSGLVVVLGCICAFLFLNPFASDIVSAILFAIISGTILNLILKELLPVALEKKYLLTNIISVTIGIGIMIVIEMILG